MNDFKQSLSDNDINCFYSIKPGNCFPLDAGGYPIYNWNSRPVYKNGHIPVFNKNGELIAFKCVLTPKESLSELQSILNKSSDQVEFISD